MTPETYQLIQDLGSCDFAPATFDKRFARDLSSLPVTHQLTEKQLICLGQMAYRYRKQIEAKRLARKNK